MKAFKDFLVFVKGAVCIALGFWLMLCAPTGWIYDLWAGTGTGQGQWPNEDVQQLRQQEDVFAFFCAQTPATVSGGELVDCPLVRLRDLDMAGKHYTNSHRKSVMIGEYMSSGTGNALFGAWYNGYYLYGLEDGTWLCVYFDDYLTLTDAEELPVGYVRYTTTEERRMLDSMTEDYEADTVYVLDMFRHGKQSWIVEGLFRLMVTVLCVAGILTLWERFEK